MIGSEARREAMMTKKSIVVVIEKRIGSVRGADPMSKLMLKAKGTMTSCTGTAVGAGRSGTGPCRYGGWPAGKPDSGWSRVKARRQQQLCGSWCSLVVSRLQPRAARLYV